jgi:hypothetical protein
VQQKSPLFDHLIGQREQRRWHYEAEERDIHWKAAAFARWHEPDDAFDGKDVSATLT